MAETHCIRLRGPWTIQAISGVGDAISEVFKTTVPSDWSDTLGADFRGSARYLRRFNCPTGLDADTTIHVVVESVDATADVSLNQCHLGSVKGSSPKRFRVDALLDRVNQLEIIVQLPADVDPASRPPGRNVLPGGLIGEVRLEIG